MNLLQLPILGLALTLFIGIYFLLYGNKKDVMSWLGAIVVIALVLVVAFRWDDIRSHLPGSPVTVAASAPAKASTPSHLTVVYIHSTPTALPTVAASATAQREAAMGTPAASPANPLTTLLTALNYSAGASCLGTMIFLVVAGILISKHRRRPSIFLTEATTFPCTECGAQTATDQLYSYKKNRSRLKTKLCSDCVGRLNATRLAS